MKVKEAWKQIFLRHLKNGASIEMAAKISNIGMDSYIKARNNDLEFADDVEYARINRKAMPRM